MKQLLPSSVFIQRSSCSGQEIPIFRSAMHHASCVERTLCIFSAAAVVFVWSHKLLICASCVFVTDSADTPGRVMCREQFGGRLHLEWEPPLVDAEASLLYTLQIREQGNAPHTVAVQKQRQRHP